MAAENDHTINLEQYMHSMEQDEKLAADLRPKRIKRTRILGDYEWTDNKVSYTYPTGELHHRMQRWVVIREYGVLKDWAPNHKLNNLDQSTHYKELAKLSPKLQD